MKPFKKCHKIWNRIIYIGNPKMETKQQCPVCKLQVHPSARYPHYVCQDCINKYGTLTWDGKQITFSNVDYTGGFQSLIQGEGTASNVHKCYINGIECWADEARFGGIVIQTTGNPNPKITFVGA
jgi:hypothetical protein